MLLPKSLRGLVAVVGVVLLAIVVWGTATTGGLIVGVVIVAIVVGLLYYGGYRGDAWLKGGR